MVGQKSWSGTKCQGTREALSHAMTVYPSYHQAIPCSRVQDLPLLYLPGGKGIFGKVQRSFFKGQLPKGTSKPRPPRSLSQPENEMQLPSPFTQGSERWYVTSANYLDCSLKGGLGPKHPCRGTLFFFYRSEQTFDGPSWRTHILSIWRNFPVCHMASQSHLLLSVLLGHCNSVSMNDLPLRRTPSRGNMSRSS